jgi:hypothetical protein
MGIINEKNIPILQTPAQVRRQGVLRGMCKYVTTRHKVEQAATAVLFENIAKGEAK